MPMSPEAKQLQEDRARDEAAKERELCESLAHLVQLPAYKYAKQLGEGICKRYECMPPQTEAERTKWETYNTLLWSMESLFSSLEVKAKQGRERV